MNNAERVLILDSCRKATNYYLIPPLGVRINFHSQQLRALNLVMALHEGTVPEISPDDELNVGVIGGGLAGITAAIGMLCKGHRVVVFETKSEALHRQSEAAHRMLHPSVNYWPDHEGNLVSSTELPFFDWVQGDCDEIISELREEWQGYLSSYEDRLTFAHSKTVKNIRQASDGRFRLWLEDGNSSEGHFDLILATVGFADEAPPDEFPTPFYWNSDDLMKMIEDPKTPNFTVSGAGDGGLIDALRSMYFFDKGALAFRLAELLQGTAVFEDLIAAEQLLRETFKQESVEPDSEYKIKSYYKAAVKQFLEARSCPLHREFYACGTEPHCQTSEKFACKLDHARKLVLGARRVSRNLVLIDKFIDDIAMSKAAPVHKFLIALAIADGSVQFEQGVLLQETGEHFVKKTDGTKLALHSGPAIYARHGAQTNFEAIVQIADKDFFHKGRTWLAESNVHQYFDDLVFNHPEVNVAPKNADQRAHTRKDRAEAALAKLDVKENGRGSRLITIVKPNGHASCSYMYYGKELSFGLPNNKIFGVKVEYGGSFDLLEKTEIG